MDDTTTTQSSQIGAILVEKSLITAAQLEQALQLQERTGERLGEIVVAEFGVSQADLQRVLASMRGPRESRFGESAGVRSRTQAAEPEPLTPTEVQIRRPIGEIFVELGFITNEQLDAALAVQRRTRAPGSARSLSSRAASPAWILRARSPSTGSPVSPRRPRAGSPCAWYARGAARGAAVESPAEPSVVGRSVRSRSGRPRTRLATRARRRLQAVEERLESDPQARRRWGRRRPSSTEPTAPCRL